MKIILTGATGAAGLEILRTAIADPAISKITVLSRRTLPESIPKSEKVIRIDHSDFLSYSPELLARVADHGACIWALGVSSIRMREDDYTRITYEYPMAAFRAFDKAGVRGEDGVLRFVFISGHGVQNESKNKPMFARVKGLTETELSAYASASTSTPLQVYNLRAGFFYPTNPIDIAATRSIAERVLKTVISPVLSLVNPSLPIKIEDLAQFSLEAAKGRVDAGIYSNVAIKELVREWKGAGES